MDLGLRGRLALVTGGARGIGLATARGFLAEGARVAIWDVAEDVEEVARGLGAGSGFGSEGCARGYRVDVGDGDSVRAGWARVELEMGDVDHVVHAAAVGSGKFGFPFWNLEPRDWERVLRINVMGMAHVAHAAGPAMAERGRGTMVFVASVAGQMGSQTDPPYSASKAANINFAQCLAKDLAPRGVRVNAVCPGMVRTALNESVWRAWREGPGAGEGAGAGRDYETWAGEKIRRLVPLGRWQTAEGVADMIVFLSSERAGDVTGQTVNVDGGFVMRG